MKRPYDHNWQKVRLVVLARDGHRCQIGLPGCTRVAEHVDHIVPISEGGARLDPSNLRAACGRCNLARKSGRTATMVAAFDAQVAPSPSRKW